MKAAQELYGENSAEVRTVGKAWTAVGIGGTDPSGIHEVPAVPAAADGHWYTIDGRRLSGKPTTKGAYIHNSRKVIRYRLPETIPTQPSTQSRPLPCGSGRLSL